MGLKEDWCQCPPLKSASRDFIVQYAHLRDITTTVPPRKRILICDGYPAAGSQILLQIQRVDDDRDDFQGTEQARICSQIRPLRSELPKPCIKGCAPTTN